MNIEKKWLYFGVVAATVPIPGGTTTSATGFLGFYDTPGEAHREAYTMCHRLFPTTRGYYDHKILVDPISEEFKDILLSWSQYHLQENVLPASPESL